MQWMSTEFTYGSARQPPEDALAHYGIKGQKWGLRRFQQENGSYTEEGKARYGRSPKGKSGPAGGIGRKKVDKEEARKNQNGKDRSKWKAKDVSDLSDEELRRRNNRLQQEQNYKNSMTPQWKKDAKQWGKEALKAILVTSVVTVLAESLKETMKPGIKKKMQKTFNKASKKSVSSLNSAKRNAAPYVAALAMKQNLLKDRFKKG